MPTVPDHWVRRFYRARSWLLCHSGLHLWAHRRNPEVSGRFAHYSQCRRCGYERSSHERPAYRQYL